MLSFSLGRGAWGGLKLLTVCGTKFKFYTKTVTTKAGRAPDIHFLNIQCLLTLPGNHRLTFLQTQSLLAFPKVSGSGSQTQMHIELPWRLVKSRDV